MLDRKDELARVVPDLVPTTSGGPYVERPIASTGGVGEHRIDSLADATRNGRWIVHDDSDAPRRSWSVVVRSLDPLTAEAEAGAPAVIVELLARAWWQLPDVPITLRIDVARDRIIEVAFGDDAPSDVIALEVPWPDDVAVPVPDDTGVWDVDPAVVVHRGGALDVLDPEASYVWAANADGLAPSAIAAESEGAVDLVTVRRHLARWTALGLLGSP